MIETEGYFSLNDRQKEHLQRLVLHSYMGEIIDANLTDEEALHFMYTELANFEDEENYEAAALLRDTIQIYNNQSEYYRKRIYK